jgi:hypothetical protein
VKEAKSNPGVNRNHASRFPLFRHPACTHGRNLIGISNECGARLPRQITASIRLMKRIVLLTGIALALLIAGPSEADHSRVIDRCRGCGGAVVAVPVFVGYAPNGQPVYQWQIFQHRCAPVHTYQQSYQLGPDDYRRDRVDADNWRRGRINSDTIRLGMPSRHAVTPAAVRSAATKAVRRTK